MDQTKLATLLAKCPARVHSEDGLTVFSCLVRFMYVNLKAPSRPKGSNKELRYNLACIIPPGADWSAMDRAAKTAWGAVGLGRPPKSNPFKPQSAQHAKNRKGFYADGVFFQCESKDLPTLIDANMQPVSADAIKGGFWGVVKVKAQGFNISGNDGVKFWCSGVQLLAEDEVIEGNGTDGFEAHEGMAPAGAAPAQTPNAAALGGW